jgi:hypothetical protein
MTQNCSGPLCHDTLASGGGFMLGSVDQLHSSLVGQKASGTDCANSGLDRVVPSNPEASLLYLKINDRQPCGTSMPVPPAAPLPADKIELVRRWIDEGAKK